MNLVWKPAESRPEDVKHVFDNLRAADRREAEARGAEEFMGWREVCEASVRVSDPCYVGYRRTSSGLSPVVIWGAADTSFYEQDSTAPDGVGIIWLLATDEVRKVSKGLIRDCRVWLGRLERQFPEGLLNMVDARNKLHVRWLQTLGFDVTPVPYTVGGAGFFPFYYDYGN